MSVSVCCGFSIFLNCPIDPQELVRIKYSRPKIQEHDCGDGGGNIDGEGVRLFLRRPLGELLPSL